MDPAKHAFSLFDEFKKFAFKGNMIDLAVALVVGGAFGKLVDSFVKTVVMPIVAALTPSSVPYAEWTIPLPNGVIPIGQFIGEFVNFLIVAFAVFIFMVKILGFLRRKEEAAPPSNTEVLLTEIRDLLKKPTRIDG